MYRFRKSDNLQLSMLLESLFRTCFLFLERQNRMNNLNNFLFYNLFLKCFNTYEFILDRDNLISKCDENEILFKKIVNFIAEKMGQWFGIKNCFGILT